MQTPTQPTPTDIAHARDIVLTPDMALHLPAAVQNAWAQLKAARGQAVHLDRLTTHYERKNPGAPPDPPSFGQMIDDTNARLAPRIQSHRAQLMHGATPGDAA